MGIRSMIKHPTTLQFFAAFFISSWACEVSRNSRISTSTSTAISLSPVEQLALSTSDAIEQIKEGVITLPNIASSDNLPTQVTKRASAGGTAEFSCSGDVSGPRTVVWRHQGRLINSDSATPTTNAPFFYSQGRTLHAHYLFIHNVSASAAGSVQCLIQSGNTTDQLHLVKQFELIPKLLVGDVFHGVMQNISTVDLHSSLTCRARINCTDGADPYFAWLFNNQFVHAPFNHYLRSLYSRDRGPYGVKSLEFSFKAPTGSKGADSYCEATMSTAVFGWIYPSMFRAECWVRTHRESNDWYVQVAYVSHEEVPVFRK